MPSIPSFDFCTFYFTADGTFLEIPLPIRVQAVSDHVTVGVALMPVHQGQPRITDHHNKNVPVDRSYLEYRFFDASRLDP